jgi:uncharacterized protein
VKKYSLYFDTSAMMRFLLRERAGHEAAAKAWLTASDVSTVLVTYAETRAALAQARRQRAVTVTRLVRLKRIWDSMWPDLKVVEVNQPLVLEAGRLAERYALRGYDAIQLAAARKSGSQFLVCADNALTAAAARLRVRVVDLNSRN